MMTSICQTRSRAEHRLDLEAIENVLLQTTNVAFGTSTKEQQEEEDERVAHEQEQDEEQREARLRLPLWTTRIIQGSIIQCIDIAQNEDAIDSTARVIDGMILTYLKDRYKLYNVWTSMAPAQCTMTMSQEDEARA